MQTFDEYCKELGIDNFNFVISNTAILYRFAFHLTADVINTKLPLVQLNNMTEGNTLANTPMQGLRCSD